MASDAKEPIAARPLRVTRVSPARLTSKYHGQGLVSNLRTPLRFPNLKGPPGRAFRNVLDEIVDGARTNAAATSLGRTVPWARSGVRPQGLQPGAYAAALIACRSSRRRMSAAVTR